MMSLSFLCCSLSVGGQENPSSPEEALAQKIDREVHRFPGFNADSLAPRVEDGEWLRRVKLDLVGMPPTGQEVRQFLWDTDPSRRLHVLDRLLESPQFSNYWARRLGAIFLGTTHELTPTTSLRIPADTRRRLATGFVHWLDRQLRDDVPWRDIVAQMASATGSSDRHPEMAWKLSLYRNGAAPTIGLAHLGAPSLFGIRLACSLCHDHPFDRWTEDETWGLSAFLARMEVRLLPATKERPGAVELSEAEEGEFHPNPQRPGLIATPSLLGTKGKLQPFESRQAALGRLLADPANTLLSRSLVNRIWGWLMGQGIVEPVDEFDMRHKPLSWALLDLLRGGFDAHQQSIRFLVRAICLSESYARDSAGATPRGRFDGTRGCVRSLSPEELVNSLLAATSLHPLRELAVSRLLAQTLTPACVPSPGEADPLPFSAWTALFVRNSPEVWEWIRTGGFLSALEEREGSLEEKVDSMFLQALSRSPSRSERERVAHFIRTRGPDGFEDAFWVLLNSHEFLTRH